MTRGAPLCGNDREAISGSVRRRHTICKQCEHFGAHRRGFCGRPLVETNKTRGCSIYIKAKLANEHCPRGKW